MQIRTFFENFISEKKMVKTSKLYKPNFSLIIIDICIILANTFAVFTFLPLTTKNPFAKYSIPALFFIVAWVSISYLLKRYRKLRTQTFLTLLTRLFNTIVITFTLFGGFILIQPASPYSENVLITILIGVFVTEYLSLFGYFAYRYAVQYDVPELHPEIRTSKKQPVTNLISEDAILERQQRIAGFAGKKVFDYLSIHTRLNDSGTMVLTDLNLEELKKIETYEFSTFIQLKKLNNIREINKMLALINDKITDNGLIVLCYRTKSTTKQYIFRKYSKFTAFLIYNVYFLLHRVIPHFFLTKRLYYDITEGRHRILSKTEVLGRLNYCGFEIMKQAKVDDLNFVFARRVKDAEPLTNRYYGLLIKLRRCGKDGKMFNVYKFRTMHPYAEFLQQFVYQQNSLAEGGKFKKDIRVTTFGRIMRKYWIDELPMLLNLLKRDMKLVGVRPLSEHYFSLYDKELQEMRVKHKPGLLPPFYADLPKTLDEIQASEMNYLSQCEKNGQFVTDLKYFFLILKNIFFGKARSA